MYDAFYGCTSLETIELPNFSNSKLKPDTNDLNSNYAIFGNCYNLKY